MDRIEQRGESAPAPWRVPTQVRRGYLLALLPAVAAQVLGMRSGARLGAALDGRLGLAEGVGLAVGALVVGWGAALAVLGLGVIFGARRSSGSEVGEREGQAWWRAPEFRWTLGLIPVHTLATLPLSLGLFPLVPALSAYFAAGLPGSQLARRGLTTFYGVGALAVLLFAHGWSALWMPLEQLGFVVLGVAFVLLVRFGRAHRAWSWLPFGLATVTLTLLPPWPVGAVEHLALLVSSLVIFAVPRWIGGRRVLEGAPPVVLVLFLVAGLFWQRAAAFAVLPSSRPPAAPARLVYASGDLPYSDNRFLLRDCDGTGWWVGTRQRDAGLLRLAESGRVLASASLVVGNNGVLDCEGGTLITLDYVEGSVVEVDVKTLELRARHLIPGASGFMHAQLSRDRTAIFANDEKQMSVFRIERSSGESTVLASGRNLRGFHVSEARGRLYVSEASRAQVFALPGGELLQERELGGRFPTNASWEKNRLAMGHDSVFVTRYLGGDVYRLDPESLEVRAHVRIGQGVRDLVVDTSRGLVFVANYQRGFIAALEAESLEEVGRLGVGRRLRQLELDAAGAELLGTSVVGGFRIDIERWLGRGFLTGRRAARIVD